MPRGKKNKGEEESEEEESKLDIIIKKLTKLQKEVEKIGEMERALNATNVELEEMRREIGNWKEEIKKSRGEIEKVKGKIDKQEIEAKVLRENIEYLLIKEKACLAEIKGIERVKGEILEEIVIAAATKGGIKLGNKDIQEVYRIQTRGKRDDIICVKFREERIRDDFVALCRKARISRDECGRVGKEPVYINESLPWATRKLFGEARFFIKKENYKFCWIKKGKIFIRKDTDSNIIWIKNNEDLK